MSGIFEQSRLLTVKEVAQVLGVKASTILNWVHINRIPFIKFGLGKKAPLRFNPKVLNRWVEENSREPGETMQQSSRNTKQRKPRYASPKTIEDFENFVENIS